MTLDSQILRALLTLVRAGLWLKAPDDPEALRLSPEQWADVMRLAGKHSVYGLVSQGLLQIEDDSLFPPLPIRTRLALKVYDYEKQYWHMLDVTKALFAEYEAQGLHPVLQKGAAVASLYEHPELRPSGDVDIWFDAAEFAASVPSGSERTSDGGVAFERDDVTVELHRTLVDVSSPRNRKCISRILKEEEFCLSGAGVRSTSPLVTMLLLNTHILKHLFGWGIGLRQICDYAKAREVLDYDKDALSSAIRAMGLGRWTSMLDALCDAFIVGSSAVGPSKEAEMLLGKIVAAGTFSHDSRQGRSTLGAFAKAAPFALSVAPGEWFWTCLSFIFGRIAKKLS